MMRRTPGRAGAVGTLFTVLAFGAGIAGVPGLEAQRALKGNAAIDRTVAGDPAHPLPDPEGSPWPGAAAALLVPGLPQLLDGERRGYLHLVLDLAGWAGLLHWRQLQDRSRREYRDLAWHAARTGSLPRVDGDFPYYEALAGYRGSGRFDRDPARPGIQPELDPALYNGRIWALARAHFIPGGGDFPGPEAEARALDYYRRHAYPEEMEWDWGPEDGAWQEFRDGIGRSDRAGRRVVTMAGLLLGNRILAVADRLFLSRAEGGGHTLHLDWAPDLGAPRIHLRIPVP